jgi:dTDP-4-amino-4,6-dideoxygalactose transaminase
VIEDCSQAHGAKYKKRVVGTMGNIAVFSTMSGKHHATGGQGGVVYTKDEKLFWKAKRFADRGKPFNITGDHGNIRAGLNCNLNELSAAIGIVQLKKLDLTISRRRQIGETVKERLHKESKAISVGWQVPESNSVYWFLRLHIKEEELKVDKNRFVEALQAEGIPVVKSYRNIPSEQPWFTNRAVYGKTSCPWGCPLYKGGMNKSFSLPNAEAAVNSHFNIHIHEDYTEKEIDDIIRAIVKVERYYKETI